MDGHRLGMYSPVPRLGRHSRLVAIAAVGLALVAAALIAAPELRVRRLAAQLDGDEHEIAEKREALVTALGPRAPSFFTGLLDAPVDGARLAAVEYLLEEMKAEALPRVAPLMADYYSQIRQRIVEAATGLDGPEARRLLLAAAGDEDVWIRQVAVAGLARRVKSGGDRAPEVLAVLARAVGDPDPAVVGTAMNAMRHVAGRDFGYRTRSSDLVRAAAVGRWREWWERHRPERAPPLPPPATITRVGVAPEFDLTDTEGQRWALPRLRGKTLLLHFFGTWCGVCRTEMPYLQRLHYENGPGLVVLGAAIGEKGPEEVRAYARRHGLTFPIALAPEALTKAYGHIHEVPITYLVDRTGRIRRRFDGDRDYDTLRRAVEALQQ